MALSFNIYLNLLCVFFIFQASQSHAKESLYLLKRWLYSLIYLIVINEG